MAEGLLGKLQDEVGYPFDHVPTKAFWPFRGGLANWGSICGAIPPAVTIMSMVLEEERFMELSDELMAWYQKFPFPEYQPAGLDLPQVEVNSSLCHISVTKWMVEAGVESRGDDKRGERCAGVTADVAKFAAEMLNKEFEEGYVAEMAPAAAAEDCMECHANEPYPSLGKEDCTECHGDPHDGEFGDFE